MMFLYISMVRSSYIIILPGMGDDVPILGAVVTLYGAMGNCCFWWYFYTLVWSDHHISSYAYYGHLVICWSVQKAIWLAGYLFILSIWSSGHLVIWSKWSSGECGNLVTGSKWSSSHLFIWLSDHLFIWSFGHLVNIVFWSSGHMVIWSSSHLVIWSMVIW